LAAALAEVVPVNRVVELHPGGGQYDMVELLLGTNTDPGSPFPRVRFNRPGSIHVEWGPDSDDHVQEDLWKQLENGLPPADAVSWVLASVPRLPAGTSETFARSLRFMSDNLDAMTDASRDSIIEWRNGYLDSSDGSGRRTDLFEAISSADEACTPKDGDPLGIPSYRFWFLLVDGEPLLAIEPEVGEVFSSDRHVNLSDPDVGDLVALVITASTISLPAQTVAVAREAFGPRAAHLARDLCDEVKDFTPGKNLSAMAEWFVTPDDERLVVVVGDHEQVSSIDDVLAYALAWQGDRDLVLILPEGHEGQTLDRLPWVDTPVRVFLHGSDDLRPAIIPSRSDVLARAGGRGLRRTETHDLGELDKLIESVTTWASTHWALEEESRPSYLSWHCAGRQVLKVARSKGGVLVTAGVDYTKDPPEGEEKALCLFVGAGGTPLTQVELAHVQARVARAIFLRLASVDRGHLEHRLQGSLASGPLKRALGLSDIAREYPAWRGDHRPGFLDFLALDRKNRLHVVETKVNPDDVTVVLQTLDYAIWVQANANKIRDERGWQESGETDHGVVCDFVCAPRVKPGQDGTLAASGYAIGGYLAGQLEAISPSIAWRISLVPDPLADPPEVSGPLSHRLPPVGPLVAEPVQGPRWSARVQADLTGNS